MEEKESKEAKNPMGHEEEEVMSEVAERAMEANVKLLVANEIAHAKRIDTLAEVSLQDAINLSRKTNDAYLEMSKQQINAYMAMAKQQGDAYMAQAAKQSDETLNFATQWHHHAIENNRYTLDRLYSVYPEEAVGIGTMLAGFAEYLKSNGWTPPASK